MYKPTDLHILFNALHEARQDLGSDRLAERAEFAVQWAARRYENTDPGRGRRRSRPRCRGCARSHRRAPMSSCLSLSLPKIKSERIGGAIPPRIGLAVTLPTAWTAPETGASLLSDKCVQAPRSEATAKTQALESQLGVMSAVFTMSAACPVYPWIAAANGTC